MLYVGRYGLEILVLLLQQPSKGSEDKSEAPLLVGLRWHKLNVYHCILFPSLVYVCGKFLILTSFCC